MSHAIGRREDLRLHHGTLNAVILPAVLRFNEPGAARKNMAACARQWNCLQALILAGASLNN